MSERLLNIFNIHWQSSNANLERDEISLRYSPCFLNSSFSRLSLSIVFSRLEQERHFLCWYWVRKETGLFFPDKGTLNGLLLLRMLWLASDIFPSSDSSCRGLLPDIVSSIERLGLGDISSDSSLSQIELTDADAGWLVTPEITKHS